VALDASGLAVVPLDPAVVPADPAVPAVPAVAAEPAAAAAPAEAAVAELKITKPATPTTTTPAVTDAATMVVS